MTRLLLIPAIAAAFGLTSCATIGKVGQLSAMAADRLSPAGVKVVEVREQDLVELPSGRERALAFTNSHQSGFGFFGGPVDFIEPALPESGAEMDGSVLPPKLP